MDRRTGVYICSGCEIGEALDCDRLALMARSEFNVQALVHPHLCGPQAAQSIRDQVAGQHLGAAVVAACSPRVNWDVFATEGLALERVNLREQVAWSHRPKEEDTQLLAEDLLRMGLHRIARTELPERQPTPVEKRLLVLGGGIAGITAALEAAEAGYDVLLVEKKEKLGGWLARFPRLFPTRAPYRQLERSDIEARIAELVAHPRVRVLTSAEVDGVSGQPGAFHVTIRQGGSTLDARVGSIVLATGFDPYDPSGLAHLGFGTYPDVITSMMMEELAERGSIIRPSDGRPAQTVAFVQCAGSRDPGHLPYCSTVCCLASLKQALYVRHANPDASVYILYRDMLAPGLYEDFYRRVQEEERVFFARGDVTRVTEDGDGALAIDVERSVLGEQIRLKADLVVLAVGMVAAQSAALQLQYRQGPGLPTTTHGFADSRYLCFPYETRRTGIYTAGCVRQPMDVTSSIEDGAGAALKAIQSLDLASSGAAVHPRAGDLSLPIFALPACTQCKRCTEECPFGALDEDERGSPRLNPTRCRRCGICMGACPVRAISFKNYSVDQLSAMAKSIPVPANEDTLRILAFVCENDAYPAFDMAGMNRLVYDASLRVIPVRCLGSVNMALVSDAISRGIDGVLLLGCKYGDDYQCHFIHGSELANRRVENVRDTLSRLMMIESERVKLVPFAITDYEQIPTIVNEFADQLRQLGPNPYRGF